MSTKGIFMERLKNRLQNAPAIEVIDEDAWETACAKARSGIYGTLVEEFATSIARLIQLDLQEGKTLEKVWQDDMEEADVDGANVNGKNYAVALLSEHWVHGKELQGLYGVKRYYDS